MPALKSGECRDAGAFHFNESQPCSHLYRGCRRRLPASDPRAASSIPNDELGNRPGFATRLDYLFSSTNTSGSGLRGGVPPLT